MNIVAKMNEKRRREKAERKREKREKRQAWRREKAAAVIERGVKPADVTH